MNVRDFQKAMLNLAEQFNGSIEKARMVYLEEVRNVCREFLGGSLDEDPKPSKGDYR